MFDGDKLASILDQPFVSITLGVPYNGLMMTVKAIKIALDHPDEPIKHLTSDDGFIDALPVVKSTQVRPYYTIYSCSRYAGVLRYLFCEKNVKLDGSACHRPRRSTVANSQTFGQRRHCLNVKSR